MLCRRDNNRCDQLQKVPDFYRAFSFKCADKKAEKQLRLLNLSINEINEIVDITRKYNEKNRKNEKNK